MYALVKVTREEKEVLVATNDKPEIFIGQVGATFDKEDGTRTANAAVIVIEVPELNQIGEENFFEFMAEYDKDREVIAPVKGVAKFKVGVKVNSPEARLLFGLVEMNNMVSSKRLVDGQDLEAPMIFTLRGEFLRSIPR